MRAILGAVLLVVLLAAVIGPPTPWPDDLDDLYRFIDEGAPGWVFHGECETQPVITWAQVKQIAAANGDGDTARVVITTARLEQIGVVLPKTGTLDIAESDMFYLAMWVVLSTAWEYPYDPMCKPEGDKVGLYGPVATRLLDRLAEYVR